MRSIENIYTEDGLVDWFRSHAGPMTLSSKWDGISASLIYHDGFLTQALTRGDGDAGEDMTAQVFATTAIPHTVHFPATLEVRGELVIARSTMEQLNRLAEKAGEKPYMSARNLVAGTMKLKDTIEVARRQVEFIPWEILGSAALGDSASERLIRVAALGFPAPDDTLITSEQELLVELRDRLARLAAVPPEIGCDGFVLKVDSVAERRRLGVGSKFANYQVCFKPQSAKGESVLREVVWQVGRMGRLTPVGIIEPLVLAGAVIERVTLNNLSWIEDMKLSLGSRVMICRSGDVIPQITEVMDC